LISAKAKSKAARRTRAVKQIAALFITCFLASVLLFSAPTLAAASCDALQERGYKPELRVETPRPKLHRNRSIKELGRMFGHKKKGNVLGLTQTQLDFGWETHIRSYHNGNSHCFWIAALTLTASYPTPDIYVAKEYFPGSCPYRAILRHEEEHVRRTRETIKRFEPRLRQALTSLRLPTWRRPWQVANTKAAQKRLEGLINELVEPIYHQMAEVLEKEQAALDSVRSYRRVFRKCKDW
jgi:hypothetical protein